MLIGGENQIAAKGTIGERRRLANHVSCGIGPRQRQHAEPSGIRDRCRQFGHRHHRRLDDRLLNPEQFADRRSHQCHLPVCSVLAVGWNQARRGCVRAARAEPHSAMTRTTTASTQSLLVPSVKV